MDKKISDLTSTEVHNDTFVLIDSSPKRYTYVPKDDITAYELAKILPYLISGHMANVPSDLLRHFKEVK